MAVISLADVKIISGRSQQATAGEAINAGDVVFTKSADSSIYLSNNNASATAEVGAIALTSAAVGDPVVISGATGDLSTSSPLTAGTLYFLSSTSGDIALESDLVAGEAKILVGVAADSSTLTLNVWDTGYEVV